MRLDTSLDCKLSSISTSVYPFSVLQCYSVTGCFRNFKSTITSTTLILFGSFLLSLHSDQIT
ncbi:hypothetical protein Hanom_Chr02g00149871 [Helianthus anomalus]